MNAYISPLAADIIGICGSILFIIGFAYANLAKAMDQLLFNALNFAGAILLLISLSVHFNLAAFVLEVAWGTIALLGIGKALWDRRTKPLPSKGGVGVGAVNSRGTPDGQHPPVTGDTRLPSPPPFQGRGDSASPSPIASDSGT